MTTIKYLHEAKKMGFEKKWKKTRMDTLLDSHLIAGQLCGKNCSFTCRTTWFLKTFSVVCGYFCVFLQKTQKKLKKNEEIPSQHNQRIRHGAHYKGSSFPFVYILLCLCFRRASTQSWRISFANTREPVDVCHWRTGFTVPLANIDSIARLLFHPHI
jgi:hypothetical protein